MFSGIFGNCENITPALLKTRMLTLSCVVYDFIPKDSLGTEWEHETEKTGRNLL